MTTIVQVGNQGAIHATEAAYRDGYTHAGCTVIGIDQAEAFERGPQFLLDQCDVARADLLVYSRTHNNTALTPAWTETWRTLEERGTKTASVHLDVFWGLPERERWIREGDPLFTTGTVFTADGGSDEEWMFAGVNHRWLPPGFDSRFVPEIAEPYEELTGRIVFVGSARGYHPQYPRRMELIQFCQTQYGSRFVEFGNGTERGPVRGAELARVYASDCLVVGDACFAGERANYTSDRVPETLGRGGLLIMADIATEEADGMASVSLGDRYLAGVHLARWEASWLGSLPFMIEALESSPEECAAIRMRGRKLAWERDTYRTRAREVLDALDINYGEDTR